MSPEGTRAAAGDAGGIPLLRRFLAGEAGASRQVERWAADIVRCRYYCIPRGEHEDLVQETLTQVWAATSRGGFELRRGLRAFVRTVATARCIDWLRRTRPSETLNERLEDSRPGPYEEFLRRDEDARLRLAIQLLGEVCREAIRLRFFEHLSYDEMATRLQRKATTLRVRVFNCIRDLRRVLQSRSDS